MPTSSHLRILTLILAALLGCTAAFAQQEEEMRGAPAEPANAAEIRAQIGILEMLKSTYPDRGAILYLLAASRQQLGETREALQLLKECINLSEGFDPSGGPEYAGLKGSKEFDELVERAQKDFPVVANSKIALVTEEKNLIPEGLAWDPVHEVFYLGSIHLRKILQITPENRASEFVPAGRDKLLPIIGIRLDPTDNSVWANSFQENPGITELLHFDPQGKLLGRYTLSDSAASGNHGFNDLIVRKSGGIVVTDSLANRVFRFDPATKNFTALKLHREVLYPNGIALASDDHTAFIADALGVIRFDLNSSTSQDVIPGPHTTLAGADGLYWHNGSLIAVQNGIGSPRIAAFKLSPDGLRVQQTTVLENRTSLTELPTTGAIRDSSFYFIANSQIDNINGDKILDGTRLAPVRIAVVRLP